MKEVFVPAEALAPFVQEAKFDPLTLVTGDGHSAVLVNPVYFKTLLALEQKYLADYDLSNKINRIGKKKRP